MIQDSQNKIFGVIKYPEIVSEKNNVIVLNPSRDLFAYRAQIFISLESEVGLPIRLNAQSASIDDPTGNLILRFSIDSGTQTQYARLILKSKAVNGADIYWQSRVKVVREYKEPLTNVEIYNEDNIRLVSEVISGSSDLSASIAEISNSISTEGVSGNSTPSYYFRKLDEPSSSFQDVGTAITSGSDTIVPYNTWFKVGDWEGWKVDEDAAFTIGSRFTLTTNRGVYDDPCANGGGVINLELKLEATGATVQPSGTELWDIVATQSQFIFSGSITDAGTTLFRNFYHLPPGQFMLGGLSESIWSDRLMSYGLSAKITASDACVASSSLTGSINFDYLVPYVTNLTASAATTAAYQVPSNLFVDVLAWYDFSNSDYYDTDGGSGFVTNFYHVLGGNLSGSFASGSRPYISSSMQNGLSTAFFSESWDAYDLIDVSAQLASQEFTIFLVSKTDNGTHPYPGPVALLNSAGAVNTGWANLWSSNNIISRIESAAPTHTSASTRPTNFYCVTSRVSGSTFESWYGSISQGPSTTTSTPQYESLMIGGIGVIAGGLFQGHIGELLLYAGQLSDTAVSQIQSYLLDKWGIT